MSVESSRVRPEIGQRNNPLTGIFDHVEDKSDYAHVDRLRGLVQRTDRNSSIGFAPKLSIASPSPCERSHERRTTLPARADRVRTTS